MLFHSEKMEKRTFCIGFLSNQRLLNVTFCHWSDFALKGGDLIARAKLVYFRSYRVQFFNFGDHQKEVVRSPLLKN